MAATSIPTTGLIYDDLVALQDRPDFDGLRLELIDGELLVSPTPNLFHQRVLTNMAFALELHVRPRQLGVVYVAPTEVRFAADVAVQPDIVFVSRERLPLLTAAGIAGAPDLVMEILSPSTKRADLTRKKALYERSGVPEYWILDPDDYSVAIFALVDGRYLEVPVVDGIARSRILPGFAIALTDLFKSFS